jgi:cellobiose phosphorylase
MPTRREYPIARPDTPAPWINDLGSEDYFALVANAAGDCSLSRDTRLPLLIRHRHVHGNMERTALG